MAAISLLLLVGALSPLATRHGEVSLAKFPDSPPPPAWNWLRYVPGVILWPECGTKNVVGGMVPE
jgi:hypothetical protein